LFTGGCLQKKHEKQNVQRIHSLKDVNHLTNLLT